jgi:glutathionyl-hydroquinone reductase
MGVLIDGVWRDEELPQETGRAGEFRRADSDAAYDTLFAALDELEARLGRQRHLVGRQITEADRRLFPTLVTGTIPKGTPVDFAQSHDRTRLAA